MSHPRSLSLSPAPFLRQPIDCFHKSVTARIAFWEPVGQGRSAYEFRFPPILTMHNVALRRDEALQILELVYLSKMQHLYILLAI